MRDECLLATAPLLPWVSNLASPPHPPPYRLSAQTPCSGWYGCRPATSASTPRSRRAGARWGWAAPLHPHLLSSCSSPNSHAALPCSLMGDGKAEVTLGPACSAACPCREKPAGAFHPSQRQSNAAWVPFPSHAQVLTALELARQARIAANRAYLTGLGLGPQAMNTGLVRRSRHGRLAWGQGESLFSWAGQLLVTGALDRSLFQPALAGMQAPLGVPWQTGCLPHYALQADSRLTHLHPRLHPLYESLGLAFTCIQPSLCPAGASAGAQRPCGAGGCSGAGHPRSRGAGAPAGTTWRVEALAWRLLPCGTLQAAMTQA